MLINIIKKIKISSRILVICMSNWYSYFNYQHYWNCDNANHLIFYLSNYFVSNVSYQRKDKHIKISFLSGIMRNLQKNLIVIWQPPLPISGQPTPSTPPPPSICYIPPLLAKILGSHPHFHQFWKSWAPPFS